MTAADPLLAAALAEVAADMDRRFDALLAVPDDASAAEYERNGYVSALEKAKTTYGSLR